MNEGLVVMRRWKFLLLLFVGMCISDVLAIVLMAKLLLRQDEHLFPIVVPATFWAAVFSLFAGMAVVASVAAIDAIWHGHGKEA